MANVTIHNNFLRDCLYWQGNPSPAIAQQNYKKENHKWKKN